MQKRIKKPTWAPTIYVKDMSAYRDCLNKTQDERYKFVRAYMDDYGLELEYERENEEPRFRYKHYFSSTVYLYASDIRQGISLSNIIAEEIKNGYERNAKSLMWRNPKIKTIKQLIEALKKDEERQLKK